MNPSFMLATNEKTGVVPVQTGFVVLRGIILTVSCVISFWLITHILPSLYSASRGDELLGGMWAVAATIFVYRYSHAENVRAALSRRIDVEDNATFFKGGPNDGKMQNFLTPDFFLVLKRKSWPRTHWFIAAGEGMQIATSSYHAYNHNLISDFRFVF